MIGNTLCNKRSNNSNSGSKVLKSASCVSNIGFGVHSVVQ